MEVPARVLALIARVVRSRNVLDIALVDALPIAIWALVSMA